MKNSSQISYHVLNFFFNFLKKNLTCFETYIREGTMKLKFSKKQEPENLRSS